MKFSSRSLKSGFTLIELLVVIAIISILAAILFPVFAKARESARKSVCVTNVRQLGMAWMMYVQDNDEQFPPSNSPNPANSEWEVQAAGPFPCKPCRPRNKVTKVPYDPTLFSDPYIKNRDMYKCPSDAGIPASLVPAEPTLGKTVWQGEKTSYCLNTVMMRVGKMAAIPLPAETYMGAEVFSFHLGAQDGAMGWLSASTGPVDQRKDTKGPVRVAYFADGHAKNMTERGIAFQCNPPAYPDAGGTYTPVP